MHKRELGEVELGLEVFTAVMLKIIIRGDVTPCNLVDVYRHYSEIYCLSLGPKC